MRDMLSHLARPWADASLNPLTEKLARHDRASLIDLIGASPHEHGLVFPPQVLAEMTARALPTASVYHPDARGLLRAREGVAAYYHRRGLAADPDHIMLTPGTSLAYWYLFRVLANAQDEILVPHPGYPLFEDIAALAGVRLRNYHLRREGDRWRPDFDDLDFQCTGRTRAVVVVSPHNPLGTVFEATDWAALAGICQAAVWR